MEVAPDTVVVLVKASPEVITQRMRETPHPHGPPAGRRDIEGVLERFEDAYNQSVLRHKFVLGHERGDAGGDAGRIPAPGRAVPQRR